MFVIKYIFSLMPVVIFALTSILIINIILTKYSIKKLNIRLLNGTIGIAALYWILRILLRVDELALDSTESGEFYLYVSTRFYYYLPYAFAVLIVCTFINIYLFKQKKRKLNSALITLVLALAAVLAVYYMPVKNKVDIKISQCFGGHNDRGRIALEIGDSNRVNTLAEVIGKYSFRRAPAMIRNEAISKISITGNREMQNCIYTIYINEDYNKNTLYVNGHRYKAMRQEDFAREVLSIFNELEP